MKIALLQEERYLPSYHGSNKSSRLLLEALARLGHRCQAFCPVRLARQSAEAFRAQLARRGIAVAEPQPELYRYHYRDVEVTGLPLQQAARHAFLVGALRRAKPDVVVVSADPRYYLLAAALEAAPERVVFVVHSHEHVPFGPLSRRLDALQGERLRRCRAVVAVSEYSRAYLLEHGELEAPVVPFPAYGAGPFPRLGRFGEGTVTLVSGDRLKGVDLFIELAAAFPDQPFAIVPWGAEADALARLEAAPNVEQLAPADDLGEVLVQTGVLLVPSQIPETFGLVAVEAMLRGIPVLASDLGGLREAALGVAQLLPMRPAEAGDGSYRLAPQELAPWRAALARLLEDPETYEAQAAAGRSAAGRWVSDLDPRSFEDLLVSLAPAAHRRQTVAVVDPYDAGFLFARELDRRGWPVVGVQSNEHIDDEVLAKCERSLFVDELHHRGDLQATLGALRRRGITAVLPGCETGVPVADLLSEAIGFRTNGTALSPARRNKYLMAEAARGRGVPVAAQVCSRRWEEIRDWARRRDNWPLVSKPPASLASEDVRLCRDEGELEAAVRHLLGRRNLSGMVNDAALVMELMDGRQYVLDTVSLDGEHFLSGVWTYDRPAFAAELLEAARGAGGWPASLAQFDWEEIGYAAVGSDSKIILEGEGELAERLFDYSCRVLDALGIRHGPAHFEIIDTADGLRLVEVGARLHGAPSTHWMCRICTGVSQLDQTIDCYLDPPQLLRTARRSYRLAWHGAKVRLHPWSTGLLRGFRGMERIAALPSFRGFYYMAEPTPERPKRLVPLDCVGVVALIHPDKEVVDRDFQAIRQLERQDLFDIAAAPADSGEPPAVRAVG